MKPVIAHIKNSYLPISETFIYGYIAGLQRYKPIVLTREVMNLGLFPFRDLYCVPKLKRYSMQWFWERSCRKLFKRELYYEDMLKSNKAKLIHAHFGQEGAQMLGVKKRLKMPLITTFYGADMSKLGRERKWQIAYKKLFREGDLFLVEGGCMKKGLTKLGCPPEKIKIQHIAVDIKKFNYQKPQSKEKDEKIKILFCGRFVEKKGLIYALTAIKLIVKKFPNLEFRIIGDGELRPEIENFVEKNNMGKHVILLGSRPHSVFAEEAQKAHILLQPSVTARDGDSEGGAPTVLLEAQATGLPVVSTYHADIPEVVVNGKSGFLVPERAPEAIAQKLECLIGDPNLRAQMGKYGREHIEGNYNIYNETKKLEDIYTRIIES